MANLPDDRESIWYCKIGGKTAALPKGADWPMRIAIRNAFREITGSDDEFLFSGWGQTLTEPERAVVENRDPNISPTTSLEQIQHERDGWEKCAAEFCRNMEYYRGLVDQIGKLLGDEAYIADDGSRSDDILRAKVPELVAARLRVAQP